MSDATMYFLPWMRRGLARALAQPATAGLPTTAAASVAVSVDVDGERVERSMRLRGPGEVVGVDQATQVVRVEPPAGTVDFEPNYFPAVELLSPDLPWMFTPAAADGDERLIPWLVLVVVEVQSGVSLGQRSSAPLPVLTIEAPAVPGSELPELTEAWAWAHVQCGSDLSASSVEQAYADEPEAFLARLMCPRRLEARRDYLACLVPSFRAGALAGLGSTVDLDDVTLAWTGGEESVELPVYHSWRFRTGPDGDFEALVRRLTPVELDAGAHDLDIGEPGSEALPEEPETIVSFQGALVAAGATIHEWEDTHRASFEAGMKGLLDDALAASVDGTEPSDPADYDPLVHDPIVAPPAYGSLPAGAEAIPEAHHEGEAVTSSHEPRWLGDVNLDPTHRSAAGLGSEVVRRNQESLMAEAWEQAAALRDINRLLNWTRLAGEVGAKLKANKVDPMADGAALQFAGRAHGRLAVPGASETIRGRLRGSSVPSGLTSAAFERHTRVGGTVGRALGVGAKAISGSIAERFLGDLPTSMSYAAYVKPHGCQVRDVDAVLSATPGYEADEPEVSATLASKPTTGLSPLLGMAPPSPVNLGAGLSWTSKTFALGTPVSLFASSSLSPQRDFVRVPVFGAEGASASEPNLDELGALVKERIDPAGTLAAKLSARIQAPESAWGDAALPAKMDASPSFDRPLYASLRRIDPEYLLPGVGELPDDCIGLASVNAAFVEAFLLGANHELAREFMWREYPTRLDGTWLSTFWDAIDGSADIDAVSGWSDEHLGEHQVGAAADGALVLIIHGELLRRYPDTRIYAVKAKWGPDDTRVEDDSVAPKDPLFLGTLDRGTVFLGFELTEEEALGSTTPGEDAGWFFVFEEQASGPRFGLDVGEEDHSGTTPSTWADLSWAHQVSSYDALDDLDHVAISGPMSGETLNYDDGEFSASWGDDAAEMARITYQRPARMLVHASAMLP